MDFTERYDFVVFGASGFTGQYVCKELVKRVESMDSDSKIAFAGRSRKKLENVLNWVMLDNSISFPMENISLLIADVTEEQSLLLMCKQARVVLDCVGPYKYWGEAVVKSCLESGSDYIDITGEPEYMKRIKMKYHDEAIAKGVYIISACGFDCIPSELGMIFAKEKFDGTLATVENYFSMRFGPKGMIGNYGTYASMVNAISDGNQKLRSAPFKNPLQPCGHKLKRKSIHYDKKQRKYCLPFLGPDISIAKTSQSHYLEQDNEIPAQFMMYLATNLSTLISYLLFGIILKVMTLTSWGTNLLLKYPRIFTLGNFSKKGPTEEQMDGGSFKFVMSCNGYKKHITLDDYLNNKTFNQAHDSKMIVEISGPEIGYVLTPIVMVQSALTLCQERANLPLSGGVYTPGPAFKKTKIIENLCCHGVKFEVVQ